jgi:hypothetical protein
MPMANVGRPRNGDEQHARGDATAVLGQAGEIRVRGAGTLVAGGQLRQQHPTIVWDRVARRWSIAHGLRGVVLNRRA